MSTSQFFPSLLYKLSSSSSSIMIIISIIIFHTNFDITRFPWVKKSLWWSKTLCLTESLPAQRGPGDTLVGCHVFEDKFKLIDCNSGFFLHDFHISHVVEFLWHDLSVKTEVPTDSDYLSLSRYLSFLVFT